MQFPGIEFRYLTLRKSFAGGRLQPRFDRRQPVRASRQDLRLREVEGGDEGRDAKPEQDHRRQLLPHRGGATLQHASQADRNRHPGSRRRVHSHEVPVREVNISHFFNIFLPIC